MLIDYLNQNPQAGIFGGLGAGIFITLDQVQPILQLVGFGLGAIVAVLTIYAKVLEIRKRKQELKK